MRWLGRKRRESASSEVEFLRLSLSDRLRVTTHTPLERRLVALAGSGFGGVGGDTDPSSLKASRRVCATDRGESGGLLNVVLDTPSLGGS